MQVLFSSSPGYGWPLWFGDFSMPTRDDPCTYLVNLPSHVICISVGFGRCSLGQVQWSLSYCSKYYTSFSDFRRESFKSCKRNHQVVLGDTERWRKGDIIRTSSHPVLFTNHSVLLLHINSFSINLVNCQLCSLHVGHLWKELKTLLLPRTSLLTAS